MEKINCGADIRRITGQGKCAVILAVESGAALGGRIERIDDLAESGVKIMTLVWNGKNELGSGHDTGEGLTPFGKEVIRKMEERRMIVDVSHLNDRGFDEVCEVAARPFVATHSNLRSICSHPRNLKEEQFCEMVIRGGLVGINLHQPFLSDTGEGKEEDVYRHIDRMLELGGENVIAYGAGTLQAGALEMSNVDLSTEFTEMIIASRAYQANSRSITTSDEMLQELLNLKR